MFPCACTEQLKKQKNFSSMDNLEKQLKSFKENALSKKEKAVIRTRIMEEMKLNPTPVLSPFSWMVFVVRHKVVVLATFVFLLAGGISATAEGSLPGDFLYRFKTGVNEGVRGWFAQGENEKAEWQLSLAGRRLNEISVLAKEKRLSEEQRIALKEQINEHTNKALGSLPEEVSEVPSDERKSMLPEEVITSEIKIGLSASDSGVTGQIGAELEMAETDKLGDSLDYGERLEKIRERLESLQKELKRLRDGNKDPRFIRLRVLSLKARGALVESEYFMFKKQDSKSLDEAENFLSEAENLLRGISEKVSTKREVEGQESAVIEGLTTENKRGEERETFNKQTEETDLRAPEDSDTERE